MAYTKSTFCRMAGAHVLHIWIMLDILQAFKLMVLDKIWMRVTSLCPGSPKASTALPIGWIWEAKQLGRKLGNTKLWRQAMFPQRCPRRRQAEAAATPNPKSALPVVLRNEQSQIPAKEKLWHRLTNQISAVTTVKISISWMILSIAGPQPSAGIRHCAYARAPTQKKSKPNIKPCWKTEKRVGKSSRSFVSCRANGALKQTCAAPRRKRIVIHPKGWTTSSSKSLRWHWGTRKHRSNWGVLVGVELAASYILFGQSVVRFMANIIKISP